MFTSFGSFQFILGREIGASFYGYVGHDNRILVKRFGKGKALSILAHKLGRAAYFMLAREKAFEEKRFLATLN